MEAYISSRVWTGTEQACERGGKGVLETGFKGCGTKRKIFFFFFFGCTCSVWKFLGSGIKPTPQQQPPPQLPKHCRTATLELEVHVLFLFSLYPTTPLFLALTTMPWLQLLLRKCGLWRTKIKKTFQDPPRLVIWLLGKDMSRWLCKLQLKKGSGYTEE